MEQAAKKLAEVEAFLHIASVISSKLDDSLYGQYSEVVNNLRNLPLKTVKTYVPDEMRSIFDKKTKRTITKLNSMMELYIGDKWNVPVEVLEWSSFFAGAAAAHCAIAHKLNPENELLGQELDALQEAFTNLLNKIIESLGS